MHSPYKNDSLYDRQSLDRSVDKSFDSGKGSEGGVQTIKVKKKYGVNSGIRESPFKQKEEPVIETMKPG